MKTRTLLILAAFALAALPANAQNLREIATHGSWTVATQQDGGTTIYQALTRMTSPNFRGESALQYVCERGGSEALTMIINPLPRFGAQDVERRNGIDYVTAAIGYGSGGIAQDLNAQEAAIMPAFNQLAFTSSNVMIAQIMQYGEFGAVFSTQGAGAITLMAQLNGSTAAIRQAQQLCGMTTARTPSARTPSTAVSELQQAVSDAWTAEANAYEEAGEFSRATEQREKANRSLLEHAYAEKIAELNPDGTSNDGGAIQRAQRRAQGIDLYSDMVTVKALWSDAAIAWAKVKAVYEGTE